MTQNAQGTIEYIVIVAVIIVISLIVVSLLTNLFSSNANDISPNSNKLYWISQPIALTDAGIDNRGNSFFVVVNNTGNPITLTGYRVSGVEKKFSGTTPLIFPNSKKTIFLTRQDSCPGEVCLWNDFTFIYVTKDGLEKVSPSNDLILEKQDNISLASFAETSSLVCVESGEVGLCGTSASSTDTNVWTAGLLNDSNVWQGNLVVDGNVDANCYLLADRNIICGLNDIQSVQNISLGTEGQIPFININGNNFNYTNNFKFNDLEAKLNLDYGAVVFSQVDPPTGTIIASVLDEAGNVSGYKFKYMITYVTANGETTAGAESAQILLTSAEEITNKKILLEDIPVSSNPLVTSRKVYRLSQGQLNAYYVYVGEISNNTDTTFIDNAVEPALAVGLNPSLNTAGGNISNLTNLIIGSESQQGLLDLWTSGSIGAKSMQISNYSTGNRMYSLIASPNRFNLGSDGVMDLYLSSRNNSDVSISFAGAGYRGQLRTSGYDWYFEPYAYYGTGHIVFKSLEGVGNFYFRDDNSKLYFGAGDDASITYDGTNMLINPKEVNDGNLIVEGNLNVSGNLVVGGCIVYNGGALGTCN